MREFEKWKKRVAANLPYTVNRVFSLRGKRYMGYGVHYGLEYLLGKVISIANDYTNDVDCTTEIIRKNLVEFFFTRLAKAEKSARKLASED